MRKLCMIGLMMAVAATAVCAKEEAAVAPKAAAKSGQDVSLKEMMLTGTVRKVEKKKKDGSVMMAWFVLETGDGKEIHLPKGKVEEFEGTKVKVTGMGYMTEKKGKSSPALKTITSIEKLSGATDSAPAQETPAK